MCLKWKRIVCFTAIGLVFFISCRHKHQQNVEMPIEPEKFAEVFTGYVVGVEIYGDQFATAILDSVLNENAVTLEEYNQSLNYYAANPEEWEPFVRLVIQNLSQRVTEVKLQREEAMAARRLQKAKRQ